MPEENTTNHDQTPQKNGHCSVLLNETIAALQPVTGGLYVDATFGDGGHTMAILAASAPDGRVLALDRDLEAIQRGRPLAASQPERLTLVHRPFSQLEAVLSEACLMGQVNGILFDVGLSSRQLDAPHRGFSFRLDGPLDMRMDGSVPAPTAADLVNHMHAEALADLFFRYGEERHSRKVARAIVNQRAKAPFTTTRQLASLLEQTLPGAWTGIHPATRVFQALRIAVNHELDELHTGLTAALPALALHGNMVAISFHSLEDRIVKQTFRQAALPPPPPTGPAALLPSTRPTPPQFKLSACKPIQPGPNEIHRNPRARSAKMRVIQRILPAPCSIGQGNLA
ncbi:MAG: 16S rRNA (cytosine(1402)-N(4))-methyltransferase RsmH [Magnetococcus sp. YQC-5]